MAAADSLVDSHGRVLRDLRVSLTDRCNFRCLYCLPETEAAQNFYRGHWAQMPDATPIARQWVPRTHLLSFEEIERVTRVAGNLARQRRRQLVSVDKANVLETSRLWRTVVERVMHAEFPDVQLEHILVDNCAMALVHKPTHFDTIVTENTFGDILSDEAAILAGSMGMLPSASLGGAGGKKGLFEPVHGTAPDIAGQGVANPIAAILSASMLLRYSLDRGADADRIDRAVLRVLEQGHRTRDIHAAGTKLVGTQEMGDLIVAEVERSY